MGVEWYDMIARRNGGYRSNAVYTIEGISAEQIFEDRLVNMLPEFDAVLDAGCGHGDFTIKMSQYAKSIIGLDNSMEMIKIADSFLNEMKVNNVNFVYASTKNELPFHDEQFDFIFDRRGPTSIINHSRILRSGGTIFGIHSGSLEKVQERLHSNGLVNIQIEEYDAAICYFPNETEFAKFLSDIPGNPDYIAPERSKELELKILENRISGRIGMKEYRYIWKANKS